MSVDLQNQYDKVFKYCYFKVKDKDVAEDLTQETFLKYLAQNSYINHGKPLAYLYTIAKNQCVDYFRQKQTEPLDENITLNDENAILTNLAVRQAVASLPSELSEIVLLRFGSELAINEMAVALGISRFSVYRKINTALKSLKQLLRKEDFCE